MTLYELSKVYERLKSSSGKFLNNFNPVPFVVWSVIKTHYNAELM